MTKVCVLGLGYIGLPTAAMFATSGCQVTGVDTNPRIVQILRSGDVHIEEPGLRTVVQAALQSGNLVVSDRPEPADAFIIAVPTPIHGPAANGNGHAPADTIPQADLRYVRAAVESIVPHLQPGNLVVLESTSPPGTTRTLVVPILEQTTLVAGRDFYAAYCPERVLPGHILTELVRNDRVVGGVDPTSAEVARDLYRCFVEGEILLTDSTTAELVKLMENAYRDVNIALANEFSLAAEEVGVNVWDAIALANHHPRVNVLRPGPGVGGHCIAVDSWFIAQVAPTVTPLIQLARHINDSMPARVVERVKRAVADIPAPTIACLGLAFKGDVDDVRESPAVEVVRLLREAGFQLKVCDPHVEAVPGLDVTLVPLEECLQGADCAVVLTDHREFVATTEATLATMRRDLVIDTRNALARRPAHD